MHRNSYDSDSVTFSPQGRLHQVEYALEATKQGSAALGLRSKSHVVLLALKRSAGELASYQKKIFRVDDHVGIAIAGLTSDARVLSNFMRSQAMSSRMLYNRPLPINRIMGLLADKAQTATQSYGRRPYGVGFLVAGYDQSGPHLYEFSPAGTVLEYEAMSIGARSQSGKTYLEKHLGEFKEASLDELIKHGLHALRETLQQDKTLTSSNTSLSIVGLSPPAADAPAEAVSEYLVPRAIGQAPEPGFEAFKIIEGEELEKYLEKMDPVETEEEAVAAAAAAAAGGGGGDTPPPPADPPAGTGEAMETD